MLHSAYKVLLVTAIVSFLDRGLIIVQAAEWGSIKGRVIVDGTPPKPAPLVIPIGLCANKNSPNETLVLGNENALVNAIVYLRVPTGAPNVAIHPQYAAALNKPVVLDNKNCRFQPHIVVVRKGQTLDVSNSDPFGLNMNIGLMNFNQLIPPKSEVTVKISQTASLPMPVVCNIHPWMKGHILSLDHPYVAVTGKDGTFEIKNIPVGEHEFQFWHETTGYLKNANLKNGTTSARGRAKLKIESGEILDLGDIKIRASNIPAI